MSTHNICFHGGIRINQYFPVENSAFSGAVMMIFTVYFFRSEIDIILTTTNATAKRSDNIDGEYHFLLLKARYFFGQGFQKSLKIAMSGWASGWPLGIWHWVSLEVYLLVNLF